MVIIKSFMLFILSAIIVVSCSKKKQEEAPSTEGDTATSNDAMSFDPQGSDSGNISGLSTIYFGYDKVNLSSEAKSVLEANANWIKSNPNVTIQVEGHCDERGSIEYNLALGERRAKAVKQYLANLGVDSAKLSIISYGEEKPLSDAHNDGAWAKNRRANFLPIAQ